MTGARILMIRLRGNELNQCLGSLAYKPRLAARSRNVQPSPWAAGSGEIPFEVLILIDQHRCVRRFCRTLIR